MIIDMSEVWDQAFIFQEPECQAINGLVPKLRHVVSIAEDEDIDKLVTCAVDAFSVHRLYGFIGIERT